jgi:amidase
MTEARECLECLRPGAPVLVSTHADLPATALPLGLSREGLPMGAQVIGGWMQDLTTIHFAELVEREFGGFIPPPRFSG